MIRKLRIKLIVACMFSLLLVLLVILGVAGILNYRELAANADGILAILSENGGSFPKQDHPVGGLALPYVFPKEGRRFSPELPYESRYFSVSLTESGTIVSVNTGKIAAVDTSTAIDYAQSVVASGRSQGFINDYRYAVCTSDSVKQIIFLDRGR